MDLTPYSTARPLLGPLDSWLGAEDAERLAVYALYEAMYDNEGSAYRLIRRGDEANPISLPNPRTIIEAKHRYLAKRWSFALDPKVGTDADRALLNEVMTNLFRREQVWSKFTTQTRYGMIRGDSVWHFVGDLEKPEGKRLSVYEVDPGSYFPILDPWNPEKRLGVHLVDQVLNDSGKVVIKRQTYRKTDTGRITYELTWWETGAWDDRDESVKLKPVQNKDLPEGQQVIPAFELDPRITAIPVYHIKNRRKTNAPFGISELQGFETIFGGVNQTITDEDLSLALQGLGLYWTNSGPPVDEDGNETNWRLGPGFVVEVDPDSEFGRVQGVTSVEASLAHVSKLESSAREAAGVPDIAIGDVDVSTAESGVALAFKMAPLLAANEEKEVEILSVMDHMLYDLVTMWLPVFEGLESPARAVSVVDNPMPVNRKATIEEVVALLSTDPPVITAEYARAYLSEKLGFDFPAEMGNGIVLEAASLAAARNVDPFASRAEQELNDEQQ